MFNIQSFNNRKNSLSKNLKVERLVYLATDDSSLWSKEIKTFQDKGYVFIGDSQICKSIDFSAIKKSNFINIFF
jgi:hypothetical protein